MAREITYQQAIVEACREELEGDASTVLVLPHDHADSPEWNLGLPPEKLWTSPATGRSVMALAMGAALAGTPALVGLGEIEKLLPAAAELLRDVRRFADARRGPLPMPLVFRAAVDPGESRLRGGGGREGYYALIHGSGVRVLFPATPYDAKGTLKTALRSRLPVVFCEDTSLRESVGPVPEEDYTLDLDGVTTLQRGVDLTILAMGNLVPPAAVAAEQLAGQDCSVDLLVARSLNPAPLDEVLASVETTGRLLLLDVGFGFDSLVAAGIGQRGFDSLDAPVTRLNASLDGEIDAPRILDAARQLVSR